MRHERPTSLSDFWKRLTELVADDSLRPFVCHSSPLDCRVFIVGFNPATTLDKPFTSYWSDETGFDKPAFMADYRRLRSIRGARPRMEAISSAFPARTCLETNICSKATAKASQLAKHDQRTEIFRFLFDAIRPDLVFVHSNQPIDFFRNETGCDNFLEHLQSCRWQGHDFLLRGRPGPLGGWGWRTPRLSGRNWPGRSPRGWKSPSRADSNLKYDWQRRSLLPQAPATPPSPRRDPRAPCRRP